jgi:hypothetical protein
MPPELGVVLAQLPRVDAVDGHAAPLVQRDQKGHRRRLPVGRVRTGAASIKEDGTSSTWGLPWTSRAARHQVASVLELDMVLAAPLWVANVRVWMAAPTRQGLDVLCLAGAVEP